MDGDRRDLPERHPGPGGVGRHRRQLGRGLRGQHEFLNLLDAIGATATFLLFAVLCAVTFVWIARKVPETRGKTLEEIQEVWAEHDAPNGSG